MSELPQLFYDKVLQCVDCGHDFDWFAGEQKFYQRNELPPPKRCPHCRQTKREVFARKQNSAAVGN